METKQTETDITQVQMDAVREAMLNPYRFMERAAASKNKRLYKLCAENGIEPSHVMRWRVKPPKTAATMVQILDAVNGEDVEHA